MADYLVSSGSNLTLEGNTLNMLGSPPPADPFSIGQLSVPYDPPAAVSTPTAPTPAPSTSTWASLFSSVARPISSLTQSVNAVVTPITGRPITAAQANNPNSAVGQFLSFLGSPYMQSVNAAPKIVSAKGNQKPTSSSSSNTLLLIAGIAVVGLVVLLRR